MSLSDWKATIAEVSALDEAEAVGRGHPPGTVASAKRMVMLLPAMEQEFSAEDARRRNGEGADGELYIDAEWGARFGAALASELQKA